MPASLRRALVAATGLLALVAASPAPAARIFDASSLVLGTPGAVGTFALGDLDHDGRADLVVAAEGTGGSGFAVARSIGGGSFSPFVSLYTDRPALRIALADLDGDSNTDVLSARLVADSIRVEAFFGDGAGGFVDPFALSVHGSSRSVPFCCDLDSDGRGDAVIVVDSSLVVLRGLANRTVAVAQVADAPGVTSVAFADVVGSPAMDVVTCSGVSTAGFIFEGNGDGTLGARTVFDAGRTAFDIVLGAFDGQPGPDLVLGDRNPSVASGVPGGFGPSSPLPGGSFGFGLVAADLNGDGNLDLASTSGSMIGRGVTSWLGDGSGGFSPRLDSGGSRVQMITLAAGDVDGDGRLDVAFQGRFDPVISIALGKGDGTFGAGAVTSQVSGSFAGLATGDFDGDGKLDVVASNTSDFTLAFARGRGDGTFDPLAVSAPFAFAWNLLVPGDFDGDGTLDLVAGHSSNASLSLLHGLGNGAFSASMTFTLPSSPSFLRAVQAVDVDKDGRLDVVVPCTGTNHVALLKQGASGLAAPVSSPVPAGPVSLRYADLDGDGRLDRVLACSNQVVVQLQDALGGFPLSSSYPMTPSPGDIEVADLNDDGVLDLAVIEGAAPLVELPARVDVFRGTGGGAFAAAAVVDLNWLIAPQGATGGASARQLVARDFDADGHVDLVARSGTSLAFVSVAHGHGDGTFAAPEAYGAPFSLGTMNAADYDRDGSTDLLGCGTAGNSPRVSSLCLLRNRTAHTIGVAPRGEPEQFVLGPVVPNPARGVVTLDLRLPAAGSVRMSLFDAAGRRLRTREVAGAVGTNRVRFDTAGVAPGLYWLRVGAGTTAAARRIVVTR